MTIGLTKEELFSKLAYYTKLRNEQTMGDITAMEHGENPKQAEYFLKSMEKVSANIPPNIFPAITAILAEVSSNMGAIIDTIDANNKAIEKAILHLNPFPHK